MAKPLVTVGLQFYNNETTLRSAIQSIINQSYQKWELILHDDGSGDRSLEVARSFRDARIRLFSDSVNRKRPTRLNESLDLARGKYYAVMDGDDISYPDRLLRQVEYLEKNPRVDLCGAYIIVFGHRGNPIGKRKYDIRHEDICMKPWAGFPMAQPTFMGRTEWFKRYYYDLRARGGSEDQDLLLRAYNSSSFANLPDIMVGYREPDLYFKKIITARYFFIQNHITKFKKQRNYRILFMAIVTQAMKCMIDGIAISTGLKYRILKHRASLVTDAELQDFENVWQSVTK